ncbi:ubiquitin-like domain-containing protein CIP73 isoform X2 [Diospyros lotus]|uniref:ubiquitin-like domain-containing protein CIP73 isoform X2 n=1 Tax=Diospyros lotus TaxID=55363 RepID=UPI0022564059|nr:ubiquitin-like domain-containing protein CIP73 isoform X2 [Diospyros lotus]
MADHHSIEGSSPSDVYGENSESMVELNLKTLDSQIYSFKVDKNIPVLLFKEKIASEIGLPVGQQRLIFRGKVLKDDHPLSEYHVENGHTLHLVARQPSELQPPPVSSSGETSAINSNRGQDANAAGPRIGQISHSVVLGTLNVGDQGEGIVPDLSRVIGAVLNSIGIGNQTATGVIGGVQPTMQAPQGSATEGARNNTGPQGQSGTQAQPGHALPNQSLPPALQIPVGAAVPLPSLNAPIPDSLHTLSEFMSRMEQALSQNGYLPNQSPSNSEDLTTGELPSNTRGVSTPAALALVLRQAQRLLSGHTIAALSHIAGRLEQEVSSTDPAARGQIQTESMQVGLAINHIGALLLELGRTILTLRMGQSPAESFVNAGPSVYISPSGPNPIMVQPFPLQTNSLFTGSAGGPSNTGTPGSVSIGAVGVGTVPRHVNIHIHTAVGPRTSNVEGVHGEHVNRSGSGDSGQTRVLPVRNVIAAVVPSRPPVTVSSASQTGFSVSQPPPDSLPLSNVIAEVNSRIRNFVDDRQSENLAPSGQSENFNVQNTSGAGNGGNNQLTNLADNEGGEVDLSVPTGTPERESQKAHPHSQQTSNLEVSEIGLNSRDQPSSSSVEGSSNWSNRETVLKLADDSAYASRSSQGNDNPEGATAVPLGLGLGGLQPKRRSKQPRSQNKVSDGQTSSSSSQNQQTSSNGQLVLQSLASLANSGNRSTPSSGLPPAMGPITESVQIGGQGPDGQQLDAASAMSQVLQSPAFGSLLAGVSQQTGVGSPNVLRNMLEQFTQSPAMRNTVNQIAQQIDGQDLGNMFSGFGRGQGGGFDLTSMVQQMMPVVSQALGGGSTIPQTMPVVDPNPQAQYNERDLSRDEEENDKHSQIDLDEVTQRIEHQVPPEDIFRSIVESATHLYDDRSDGDDLVNQLCSEEGLASEYLEVLCDDLQRRLLGEKDYAGKS